MIYVRPLAQHIIVDFEIASINAFVQYFPTTKVQGCFFPFMSEYLAQGSTIGTRSKIHARCRICNESANAPSAFVRNSY